jgi:hypothetical protein
MTAVEYQRYLQTGKLPDGEKVSGKQISRAEVNFENLYIKPRVHSGEIASYETQVQFVLFEKTAEHREIVFTPDFIIHWASGMDEVVEMKGKQIRKFQRDYPLRRRRFIELYGDRYKYREEKSEDWTR